MITVWKIGARTINTAPLTGEKVSGRRVQFIEYGRGGANPSQNTTTRALSQAAGQKVGLNTFRTHTQFIPDEDLKFYKEGMKLNLFINRLLVSTPEMIQQSDVSPRKIGGKPTFFVTEIDTVSKEDRDERMPNEALIKIHPEYFTDAVLRAASVEEVEEVEEEEVVNQPAQQPANLHE
jgi:hypothetical protein